MEEEDHSDALGTLEPEFPLEFVVEGTPVSLQGSPRSRDEWKERVRKASLAVLPEGHWATDLPISLTIFYFPEDRMEGDVDNIVKHISDALKQHIFLDDNQTERVVVQKFEPERIFQFSNPTAMLALAIAEEKPISYIRVSIDPHEELR